MHPRSVRVARSVRVGAYTHLAQLCTHRSIASLSTRRRYSYSLLAAQYAGELTNRASSVRVGRSVLVGAWA
eukprot:3028609-Rhodomonas_salina.5